MEENKNPADPNNLNNLVIGTPSLNPGSEVVSIENLKEGWRITLTSSYNNVAFLCGLTQELKTRIIDNKLVDEPIKDKPANYLG